MRKTLWFSALLAGFVMIPAMAGAQQSSSSSSQTAQTSQSSEKTVQASAAAQVVTPKTDSLAEAARKARAAEKNAPKAAMVFTNDNLPAVSGGVSVVGQAPASSTAAASASSASAAASGGSNDEAAWRQKFADARHKIDQDKKELAIMQRELGELNVQYYPNPTQALKESMSRSDINKKQAAIDAKQKQLAADEQALSDLEDQLRKAGGDPGWARE